MRQMLRLGLVVIAMGTALVVPASGAWASNHFDNLLPGTVTCRFSISLHFSPALTVHGGGTATSAIGKATVCQTSDSRVTLKRVAKLQQKPGDPSPFGTSPGMCGGAGSSTGGTFSVLWKGSFNGSYGGTMFSGPFAKAVSDISTSGATEDTSSGFVELTLKPGLGSTVQGSFNARSQPGDPPPGPGAVQGELLSSLTASQVNGLCAGRGIRVLKFAGTLTIS